LASLTLRARAKVNLGLLVGGRRPDGFHDIVSVILPVGLHDTVSVRRTRHGIRVRTDDPSLPGGPENLAWQAADRFLRAARLPGGCTIRIRKRIPAGAGLGGGSADAAAVLTCLSRLCGNPLPRRRLFRLALELGSDVPALLLGTACTARGRGERLRPLRLPKLELVLCLPGHPVSTAWAYRTLDRKRSRGLTSVPGFPSILAARLRRGELESAARLVVNDFEPVVFARHPGLERAKRLLLEHGCPVASLSGSGSTVFGLLPRAGRGNPMAGLARHGFRSIRTSYNPA